MGIPEEILWKYFGKTIIGIDTFHEALHVHTTDGIHTKFFEGLLELFEKHLE